MWHHLKYTSLDVDLRKWKTAIYLRIGRRLETGRRSESYIYTCTVKPVWTEPPWNYLFCSESTGVWFIQVKLTKISTLGLDLNLYRILIYSGFCLYRISIYSGFSLYRILIYSGFSLYRILIYSGFSLDWFHCTMSPLKLKLLCLE